VLYGGPVTDLTGRLWGPNARRFVRIAAVSILGMLPFGVVIALLAYPSWQLGVSAVCVIATLPIVWVGLKREPRPYTPGVSSRDYLRGAAPAVVAITLLALGSWLFSMAPID
jgi:hypothetical protein